eukprot:2376396-Amphidinium_carterae.2
MDSMLTTSQANVPHLLSDQTGVQDNFRSVRVISYNALSLHDNVGLHSTGQLTHLCQELLKLDVSICAIQESRLELPLDFHLSNYEIHHTAAIRGNGGLLTLVRKDAHVAIVSTHSSHPRLQMTTIRMFTQTVRVINGHAPVRDAPVDCHRDFQLHLTRLTTGLAPQDHFLIGIDLNARLAHASREFDIVGPYTTGSEMSHHITELMHHLQQNGLHFANTLVPPLDPDGEVVTPMRSDLHDLVTTWRHHDLARKCSHQIDFFIVGTRTMEHTTACRPMAWASLSSLHNSDHRPLFLEFLLRHPSPTAPRRCTPRHRRFISEQHATNFDRVHAKALDNYFAEFPSDTTPPMDQLLHLQMLAMNSMQKSCPVRVLVPRKPWISQATLCSLTQLNRIRRLKSAWWEFKRITLFPPPVPATERLEKILVHVQLYDEFKLVVAEELDSTTARIDDRLRSLLRQCRSAIRLDKVAWVDTKCSTIDSELNTAHSWHAYHELRSVSGTHKKQLKGRLRDHSGELTSDPSQLRVLWNSHWAAHFRADTSHTNSFINHLLPQSHMSWDSDICLASEGDVEKHIKGLAPRRASPNILPIDMWRRLATTMAPPLTRAINEHAQKGCLANSWCGAVTIPILKKHKDATDPNSFRPIQLLLAERKVAGRLLLETMKEKLVADTTQFCHGSSAGTCMPHFALSQITRLVSNLRLHMAIIFLDITAAYDSIVRQMVLPCDGENPQLLGLLVHMGFTADQARETLAYIKMHPSCLLGIGLPPYVISLLRCWLHGSWLTDSSSVHQLHQELFEHQPVVRNQPLVYTPSVHSCPRTDTLDTSFGVLQGDPISTVLFTAMLRIALDLAQDQLAALDPVHAQQCLVLDVPSSRTLEPGSNEQVAIRRLCFADDVACPLVSTDAKQLLRTLVAFLELLVCTFRRFGLSLNFCKGKSEIMLKLSGSESRSLWQSIKVHSRLRAPLVLQLDEQAPDLVDLQYPTGRNYRPVNTELFFANQLSIHITDCYLYLGTHHNSKLSTAREIATRKACTLRAFNTHSKVLTSPRVAIARRIQLTKTMALGHLYQQHHTMLNFSPKDLAKLNSTFLSVLKRTCRLNKTLPHAWQQLEGRRFLLLIGECCLADRLLAQRLLFFQRVVMVDNPIIRALAAYPGPGSFASMWIRDLTEAQLRIVELQSLPLPSMGSLKHWISYVVLAQTTWKALLKRHFTTPKRTEARLMHELPPRLFEDVYHDTLPEHLADLGDEVHPETLVVQPPVQCQWSCDLCDRAFATHRGLCSHRRNAHKVIPPLALRVTSNECACCGAALQTRSQLLQHLQLKSECGLFVLHNVAPMTQEAYFASVSKLNAINTALTRDHIPRTGPIPSRDGRPVSQAVAPRNPYT